MRRFNVTGSCDPELHYMVDIRGRLEKIKALVDHGDYFTVNRARQYGKTTTLLALAEYLERDYIVISLDFQRIGNAKFATEHIFCMAFSNYLKRTVMSKKNPVAGLDNDIIEEMAQFAEEKEFFAFDDLFPMLSDMCDSAKKPVVLIIDEVDSAANNQVFLDFLAQFRSYYLDRRKSSTFQSVILAGVYDVKNIKVKIRPEAAHKVNSPWNTRESNEENESLLAFDDCSRNHREFAPYDIATDFLVDMSFSADDIEGMLCQYEKDYQTGMDTGMVAKQIYEYTSGYPFLVSKLCKLLDERIAGSEDFPGKNAAWTREGIHAAVNLLVSEKNTLFDSLTGKPTEYPELKNMFSAILFDGKDIPYVATNHSVEIAAMLGFVSNMHNIVAVSNRIFEIVLYNHLISEEIVNSRIYDLALVNKYQFTQGRHLNMKSVLEGFVKAFTEVSQGKDERFIEEEGRKYFMLYLKPIINGTGHCYVETRTRNLKRTDLIVDYLGEQFVIEMKLWNGAKYHMQGEHQLAEYLDYYGLKEGYMIIFNFNKHKEIGVKEIQYGGHILIEATV